MSDGTTFDMESFDDELKDVMKSAQRPVCSTKFRHVIPYRVYPLDSLAIPAYANLRDVGRSSFHQCSDVAEASRRTAVFLRDVPLN